jgi:hypothetical protein
MPWSALALDAAACVFPAVPSQLPCDVAAALGLVPGKDSAWHSLSVPVLPVGQLGRPSSVTVTQWAFTSCEPMTVDSAAASAGAVAEGAASGDGDTAALTTCAVCGCNYQYIVGSGGPDATLSAQVGGGDALKPAPQVGASTGEIPELVPHDPDFVTCPAVGFRCCVLRLLATSAHRLILTASFHCVARLIVAAARDPRVCV